MASETASTQKTEEEEPYDPQFEFCECCRYGDEETGVAILENYPVDPCKPDENGTTPIHAAAANGLEILMTAILKKPNINVNVQTPDGFTPLHYAAMLRKNNIIEMLIKAGADGKIKNKYGQTPIYEVCESLSDGNKNPEKEAEEAKTVDLLLGPDSEIPEGIQVPDDIHEEEQPESPQSN